MRLGRPLGKALKTIASSLTPETLIRWIHAADEADGRRRKVKKRGSPKTPSIVERLILRIARETGCG